MTSVFNRPRLILQRLSCTRAASWTPEKPLYHIVPRDNFLYKRRIAYPDPKLSIEQALQRKLDVFAEICAEQTDEKQSVPALHVRLETTSDIKTCVSDSFYAMAKSGAINTKRASIERFLEDGVELSDGTIQQADVVIFCTGFDLVTDLLPQNVLSALEYDKNNQKVPYLTYKYTFNPNVPNLALICQSEGLAFTGSEMQAKWAARVSNK